jgi:acyl-coenzyme A synthetase/AMP-(fatty) acid ligase
MLRGPIPPLPALRHGLSAGEKLSPALCRAWEATSGCAVHEAFGMSECSTFISGSPERPAPPGSSGYGQPGRRVAILTPEGQPAAFDAPGVIAVSADDPGLMLEYLGAPEATRARFSADGAWFVTGDIGCMAPDGAITYLGRDDDMMNAGGYRVSPLEVEAALLHHPAITDVAAAEITVKSDTTVIAAYYCAPKPLDEADLRAFAASRLARYKCPRVFIHSPALPRGANGKILRRLLRQDSEAQIGQA